MAASRPVEQADPAGEVGADFKFVPPPPALAPYVEYFFSSRVTAQFLSRVDAMRLPEAEAQLVFAIEQGASLPGGTCISADHRASLFFQPAHLQAVRIPGSIRSAIGVALKPSGVALITQRRALDFGANPLIAVEDLWGAEGPGLRERMIAQQTPFDCLALLEAHLVARARDLPPPDARAVMAVQLIRRTYGEISLERLAKVCGFTSRTVRSAVRAEAGVSPKHLARIVRIRRALDLLQGAGVSLRDAAAASAFSDQAHMSREFRELVGLSPARLNLQMRARHPRVSTERKLTDTGLLVLPKIDAA